MVQFSPYGTIFEEENVALSNKRSNYMIDKSFQVNFVVKFIILIVSCAILSGIFLAVYYYITHDIVISNGKEIYVRLMQKEVPIPKKQPVPAGLQTVTRAGRTYTVQQGMLYLVDGKTMYPTYNQAIFRLQQVRQGNRTVLQLQMEELRNGKKVFAAFQDRLPGYVVKDGVLGEEQQYEGKLTFTQIKPSVSGTSDDDFKDINVKDIKGIYDRFDLIIWPLITNTLIFILITIVFGIFYSHRLAGPIYRINISLERIISGDLDFQVRLRRTDAFQHIGERLNALLDRLRSGELGGKKTAAKPAAKKPAPKKGAVKKAAPKKSAAKKR